MAKDTKQDDDECPGCGSSKRDREVKAAQDDTTILLKECPHCGSLKCNMCDMGDDVECISCDEPRGDE